MTDQRLLPFLTDTYRDTDHAPNITCPQCSMTAVWVYSEQRGYCPFCSRERPLELRSWDRIDVYAPIIMDGSGGCSRSEPRPPLTFATGGNAHPTEERAIHQANIERHLSELLVARNRDDMAAAGDHADAIVFSATAIRELARRRAGTRQ
jgi:hypothetical protein